MNGVVDNIYFLGIGGIGMSALARYYHRKGNKVSGYDKTPSPLTKRLEEEGIAIHYEDNPNLIPDDINMVIITPAIPSDSLELNYLREKGIKMMKRSEVLGEISNHNKSVAVSGTHGKTTVTALITHLLSYSKRKISAFVGGIARNIDSNVIIGDENDEFVVMEADEFDRSFLRLSPYVSVVTSIDADHLDIYGDTAHLEEAFNQFVAKTSSDGVVVYNAALPIKTACKSISYGYEDADVMPKNVKIENEMTKFDLVTKEGLVLGSYEMSLYGRHNVMNAMAAIIVSLQLGLDIRQIKEGLATFLGVQRRFDIRYRDEKVCYIDDYAHHPEEITAALSSIRGFYPEYRHTVIFQPHLYTRTRDFAEGFAASLSNVDRLILLDIYPAREEPIPGVTSEIIFRDVTAPEKILLKKGELMDYLRKDELGAKELYVTVGAGDIDRFIEPIKELLTEKL